MQCGALLVRPLKWAEKVDPFRHWSMWVATNRMCNRFANHPPDRFIALFQMEVVPGTTLARSRLVAGEGEK